MEGPHSNRTPSTTRSLVRADRDGNENDRIPATCPNPHQRTVHPHYGADPNERRYFPREVLYAPIKFQGVGLKNIYITMGLLRVDLIASEGKANSITGDLVRTSIEATKIELGLPS